MGKVLQSTQPPNVHIEEWNTQRHSHTHYLLWSSPHWETRLSESAEPAEFIERYWRILMRSQHRNKWKHFLAALGNMGLGSWQVERWVGSWSADKKTFVFRAVLLPVIELLNGRREELLTLGRWQTRVWVHMGMCDAYLLISLCVHTSAVNADLWCSLSDACTLPSACVCPQLHSWTREIVKAEAKNQYIVLYNTHFITVLFILPKIATSPVKPSI